MNFKTLTEQVAAVEGKKQQVNIAQIKEITRIVLILLASLPLLDLFRMLKRYQGKNIAGDK